MYTEDLNGNTVEEIKRKDDEIGQAWVNLYNMDYPEPKAECLKSFKKKASSGLNVFDNLLYMTMCNWQPTFKQANFKPEIDEAMINLGKLMDKLKASAENQSFVLGYDNSYVVYYYRNILVPTGLKFFETKTVVTNELYWPFKNQNHDNRDCVRAKDLPRFYRKISEEC